MSFYYLLYCLDDDSYCLHGQSDVLCDSKVAKVGDNVIFWHRNKKWNGQIIQKSRSEEYIEGELAKLNKEKRRGKSAKPSVQSNLIIEGKRGSRIRRSYSPIDDVKPNKKKASTSDKQNKQPKSLVISDETSETAIETSDDLTQSDLNHSKTKELLKELDAKNDLFTPKKCDTLKKQASIKSQPPQLSPSTSLDEGSDTPNSSQKNNDDTPSPDDEYNGLSSDELNKIISKMKAQNEQGMKRNKKIESAKKDDKSEANKQNQHGIMEDSEKEQSNQDSSNDDDEHAFTAEIPRSRNQLFGKDFPGAKMIHLRDEIYCKEYDYVYATSGGSTKASHVARRLMVGVFKNEAVLRCTLTGASPKAHGKERQSKVVEALDSTAKNAILQFAMMYAQRKKWVFQPEEKVRAQMSQKLGEIKRDMEKKRE